MEKNTPIYLYMSPDGDSVSLFFFFFLSPGKNEKSGRASGGSRQNSLIFGHFSKDPTPRVKVLEKNHPLPARGHVYTYIRTHMSPDGDSARFFFFFFFFLSPGKNEKSGRASGGSRQISLIFGHFSKDRTPRVKIMEKNHHPSCIYLYTHTYVT